MSSWVNWVRNYSAAPLHEGQPWLSDSHQQWENGFQRVRLEHQNFPGMGVWKGTSQQAAQLAAEADALTVQDRASMVQAAQATMVAGASTLDGLRSTAQSTIQEAESAGWRVHGDGSMDDTLFAGGYPNEETRDLRQAQAKAHQGAMLAAAGALRSGHETVMADLRAHTATLAGHLAGSPGASMVGHGFKVDGPDGALEPAMPEIGDEHLGGGGGGGGQTPLEAGLGGPPGPPGDWWKASPAPADPHCSPVDLAKDTVGAAGSTAGEIGLGIAMPAEGPGAVLGGVGLIANGERMVEDYEKIAECLEKGVG